MGKGIGNQPSSPFHIKPRPCTCFIKTGCLMWNQICSGNHFKNPICIHDPIRILFQKSFFYPNILMKYPPFSITVLTGTDSHVKGGSPVPGKELRQAIGMVVMSMGQHTVFNLLEIYAKAFRIFHKGSTGSRVKQKLVALILNIHRQSPLTDQSVVGLIINQNSCVHFPLPTSLILPAVSLSIKGRHSLLGRLCLLHGKNRKHRSLPAVQLVEFEFHFKPHFIPGPALGQLIRFPLS